MAGSSRINSSLPKIRAVIGHIPQRLKTLRIDINRSRLEILRRMITRLVREERCEFPLNRAVEARPYMERLLQLGIFRERDDEYTNEMVDWWLMEGDLREKFFDVLVPRFAQDPGPYTSLYRLPNERLESYVRKKRIFYRNFDIAVLELKGMTLSYRLGRQYDELSCHGRQLVNKMLGSNEIKAVKTDLSAEPGIAEVTTDALFHGNPFPPVVPEPEDHSNSLLNVLLKNALQKRIDATEKLKHSM